ncbi:hypothetical protein PsorP6_012940 [Peronosclerospora sorghi]|uniref:Uncharacterized protein n=1 Tax=Peronosclerospora sorghi TaxID=230839 RepID=A0ACC0WEP7_9STRA|nr:hypothetical protein PsorP6_012940 [Peronosclerospora sorghi]
MMTQICVVCETIGAKYKCPTCRTPYCSLICCKKHKETPCEPLSVLEKPHEPLIPPSEPVDEDEDENAERLTDEQLSLLLASEEVKKQLANPVIIQTLTKIESSQNKMKMLEMALLDPTFAEFMYRSLDAVK